MFFSIGKSAAASSCAELFEDQKASVAATGYEVIDVHSKSETRFLRRRFFIEVTSSESGTIARLSPYGGATDPELKFESAASTPQSAIDQVDRREVIKFISSLRAFFKDDDTLRTRYGSMLWGSITLIHGELYAAVPTGHISSDTKTASLGTVGFGVKFGGSQPGRAWKTVMLFRSDLKHAELVKIYEIKETAESFPHPANTWNADLQRAIQDYIFSEASR